MSQKNVDLVREGFRKLSAGGFSVDAIPRDLYAL
jgi:hypothetical protein